MSSRRTAAPTVLGLCAALVGLIGVFSALTPEFASRLDIVQGVLPPGVPEAARVLALAFGLTLIWLSRSLARRKRRAWQLAVALVVASAAAHLAKGLDFEEAFCSTLLLAALLRYRRCFTAPGDPASTRPLLRALAALAVLGVVGALHAWQHVGGDVAPVLEESVELLAGAVALWALYLWLRPVAGWVRQTTAEREQARRVVSAYGRDSLAFFALRRDKSYFFSPSGRALLAYRVVRGSALVSGDPIGEAGEFPELLSEFRRVAQAQGWRVAVLAAGAESVPLYRGLGFSALYVGDEAVVRPSEFSLEGRFMRKVRQSVHRLERAGYSTRVVPAAAIGDELRAELRVVSAAWRGRWPERGFTMAMDALFEHPEARIAYAEAGGRVGGFVHLVPSPASGGYSLSAMRRRPDTPNGLMEYLLTEVLHSCAREGVPELSLNFAVFGRILRVGREGPAALRALRRVLLGLDRAFQLDRLLSFNRKFQPEWRPRYLCVERLTDFPLVGLAYLEAESLLTPPGPWVRSEDLAAR